MSANYDVETGFHYGVINANHVNGWVLEQIMNEGTDLYYADGLKEMEADAKREWLDMDEETRFEAGDLADYIEEKTQEFNDSYESNDAPYEFELDGVIGLFSTGSNTITIFRSPHYTKATQCSPCYPNAGDLDSVGEDAHATWAGAAVDAYDVPPSWREMED